MPSKLCGPQNIFGASQENRVAAFSQTTCFKTIKENFHRHGGEWMFLFVGGLRVEVGSTLFLIGFHI